MSRILKTNCKEKRDPYNFYNKVTQIENQNGYSTVDSYTIKDLLLKRKRERGIDKKEK